MIEKSAILEVLGPSSFARFETVRVPARVLWFNFALARECGLDVPRSGVMTGELEKRAVRMFSLRALRRGESPEGRELIPLHADRYGGADIAPGHGAGRAGFLTEGNFYLKGIGLTPLYRHLASDDFQHTHGGFSIRESMFEAVFGEVNAQLLRNSSARILAIIDQGDCTVYPNGEREPRAIAVRCGMQLRPAHLFGAGLDRDLRAELFFRMVRSTGQIVLRKTGRGSRTTPDLKATLLRIVEDHAITAAELFRWRMLHGAISMSNMEMSGAMLDTTTQSAQPRTAPVKILTYHPDDDIVYGREHMQRARELELMYLHILRGIPLTSRTGLNAGPIDFRAEMAGRFERHLQIQMLRAAGLQSDIACYIQAHFPEVASSFASATVRMAGLRNPGSVNANRVAVEEISIVDVFGCLAKLPALWLAGRADHAKMERLLNPVFRGNSYFRDHQKKLVGELSAAFLDAYAGAMAVSDQLVKKHYGTRAAMRRSVIRRAEEDNQPLDRLYRWNILRDYKAAVAEYRTTSNPEIVSGLISLAVTASVRGVRQVNW